MFATRDLKFIRFPNSNNINKNMEILIIYKEYTKFGHCLSPGLNLLQFLLVGAEF
jgi:hypothetical protein